MVQEIARLSPSIAKILLQRSPIHAWQAHRLLGGTKKEASSQMDEGLLIEAILFDLGIDRITLIDADSFRTKEAQLQRDNALVLGQIPILRHKYDEAENAAEPMFKALKSKGIDLSLGEKQKRLEWQSLNPQCPDPSKGVACSGVLDQLILDEKAGKAIIRDLKTTDNAHPRTIQRKMMDMGYDIQAAAYLEAVQAIYPQFAGRVEFEFVYIEREAPYAVTVARLAGSMQEVGQRRWTRAVNTWGQCLATNRWPDYSNIPIRIEALPWQLNQEAEQELDDQERDA